jgi:YD repeat-containing protein
VRTSAQVPVRCVTLADAADSARAYRRLAIEGSRASTVGGTPRSRLYPDYDVVLDVPVVCVDQLALKTDTLRTKFVLDTRVTNLVRVNAGADIMMENVDVSVKGVHAKALLLVDLTEAANVVDQTLTFVDSHPEPLPRVAPRLLLLGVTRNAAGQTVQRLVNANNGDIIERTVAGVGEQVVDRNAGNVTELAAVDETRNVAGTLLTRVRDPSGAVVTFARDARGQVSEVTVRGSSPP